MNKCTKFYIPLFLVLYHTNLVHANPLVSAVSGTVGHSLPITISGSNFGTKSSATPLMWDDGESGTAGIAPDSTPNAFSQVGYSQVMPQPSREGDNISESYQMKYRDVNYSPVSQQVAGPHNRSTKYMVGGHESLPNDGARDVTLTVATPSAYSDRWFMQFYYRVDPGWSSPCIGSNHKITVYQDGTAAYASGNNQYVYNDFGDTMPCSNSDTIRMKVMGRAPAIGGLKNETPDTSPPWFQYGQNSSDNPRLDWVKIRMEIAQDTGFVHLYVNETMVWGGSGNPNFFTGSGTEDLNFNGIRSITAGGYHATNNATSYPNKQSGNDYRYFDDVYIDSTLSRVMIGNSSIYSACTILEPQIPSTWSETSITARVNLGKLLDSEIAYLYVFDANNNHNAEGIPVTIGGGRQ